MNQCWIGVRGTGPVTMPCSACTLSVVPVMFRRGRRLFDTRRSVVELNGFLLCWLADDSDAEDSVSSEREEVVLNAYTLEPQHFLPNMDQSFLNLCAWSEVSLFHSRPHVYLVGQRVSVDLSVSGKRQLFQNKTPPAPCTPAACASILTHSFRGPAPPATT